MTTNTSEFTPPCCEAWTKICGLFSWRSIVGDTEQVLLPNIKQAGTPWRVNYCPACGADRRGVIEKSSTIDESRNGIETFQL